MHLNHLNLCVPNVSEARAFFETHFGLGCQHQEGETIAILTDEAGFVLSVSGFGGQDPSYPKAFHLGFMQQTFDEVHAMYDRMRAAGLASASPPQLSHGRLTFYFKGPGNILIEVSAWAPEAV